MGDKTEIQWTDSTWNPVSGCTKVSSGCKFCYAERITEGRLKQDFTKVTLHPERLEQPLRWRKPRRIFVNSMSDLFHEDIPDLFIVDVFRMMNYCHDHQFQVLTKRIERVVDCLSVVYASMAPTSPHLPELPWPLLNVWLGVSCENQEQADKRIPLLLQTPAAVRFVSLEPLLGPIDIRDYLKLYDREKVNINDGRKIAPIGEGRAIAWVIAGGESGGPPERALVYHCETVGCYHPETNWHPKPEALYWARTIRDQCVSSKVPFHFKQWGGPRPKSGGRLLDGQTWDEFPS